MKMVENMTTTTDLPMMIVQAASSTPRADGSIRLEVLKSRKCDSSQAFVLNCDNMMGLSFAPPMGCCDVSEERAV